MKLCTGSYSFSQYLLSGKMNVFDCVDKAAEMGFDGIEIEYTNLPGEAQEERLENAAKVRARAETVGIELTAYTVNANLNQPTAELFEVEIARLRDKVDVAAALGAKLMRHDVCWNYSKTGKGRSFDMMLPTLADGARRTAEYAAQKGIITCSENHGRIAQDSDRMERLFSAENVCRMLAELEWTE